MTIETYDIETFKEKIKSYNIEDLCNAFTEYALCNKCRESVEAQQAIISELRKRDQESFYAWVYDKNNQFDPAEYFLMEDKWA